MYWWVKPDRKNYRLIYGMNVPYLSTDFLGIESDINNVEESLLNFKFDFTGQVISDFLISALHPVLICKPETVLLFGKIFSFGFSRFYCRVDSVRYVMLACQIEHFGFDYDRSIYKRYDLPSPRNRISAIEKLYLKKDFKATSSVFRVGDEISSRYELIVGDDFRNIYTSNNLTGLCFFEAV